MKRLGRLLVVGSTCASLLMGGAVVVSTSATAAEGDYIPYSGTTTIDTANRTAVFNAYRDWYLPTQGVQPSYNGDATSCTPGTQSEDTSESTLDAINFFRAMAGVDSVSQDQAASERAQKRALIMHANNQLNHAVPDTWNCVHLNAGYEQFEIIASYPGARAVFPYINDHGIDSLGHRRALLDPVFTAMGFGTTNKYSAMQGSNSAPKKARKASAWPSKGYVPIELTPAHWSYDDPTRPVSDFASAEVTITKDGEPIPVIEVIRGTAGVSWKMPQDWDEFSYPYLKEGTYTVTIRTGTGALITTYDVHLFRATATISGSLRVDTSSYGHKYGSIATANTSALTTTPSEATYTFQWLRDGVPIPGATGRQYQFGVADIGRRVSVEVRAVAADYAPSAAKTYAIPIAILAPTPSVTIERPTTVASPEGQTLTARVSQWSPVGIKSATYQWHRDGQAITGATSRDYVTSYEDAGSTLTVKVIEIDANDYEVELSESVTVGKLTPRLSVKIVGTAQLNQTLTVDITDKNPTSLDVGSYVWKRGNTEVGHGPTYDVQTADLGQPLTVTVTGRVPDCEKARYTQDSVTATSEPVTGASIPFTSAPTPTISGTVRVDQALTANTGSWNPTPALSYQWLANGTAISGATAKTYTVKAADVGKKISVRVKGTLAGYVTTDKTSAQTAAVAAGVFRTAPTPTITGTRVAGKTLTANPGTWSPSATLAYQWLADGKAISNAKAPTYVLKAGDIGKKISVKVTATKTGYTSVAKTSGQVATVSGLSGTRWVYNESPTLRKTPAGAKAKTLDSGTAVTIQAKTIDGKWWRVKSGSTVGWIEPGHLTGTKLANVSGTWRTKVASKMTKSLSAGSTRITTLKKGTKVVLLAKTANGARTKVKVGKTIGWVDGRNLRR